MNPVQLFVRGCKITISNMELPLLLWLGSQLLVFLCIPLLLFLGAPALMTVLSAADRSAARGMDGAALLQSVADHWGWLLAGGLAGTLWLGFLLMAFLYLEAGLLGALAEAEGSVSPEDLGAAHRFGYAPSLRKVRLASLPEQVRRWGWPVTVVASIYFVPLLLMAVLFLAVAGAGVALTFSRPAAFPFAVLSAGALALLLVPVSAAIQLHYRLALLCTVAGDLRGMAAVRAATRAFRDNPWEVLAVYGIFFAASLFFSTVGLLVGVPLTLVSLTPLLGAVLIPVRLFFSMAQMFLAFALWLALMAALLPLVRRGVEAQRAPGPPRAEPSAPLPVSPESA